MKKLLWLLLTLCLALPCHSSERQKNIFAVLDAGEGQALLLASGEQGMLIDVGNFGRASHILNKLNEYGVHQVDHIVLTHLHPDHASGIFRLMEEFPLAVIHESGHRIPFHPFKDGYRWVAEALDNGDWQVRKLRQGDSLSWNGFLLNILWPGSIEGELLNDHSIVLFFEFCGTRVLAMGDVGMNVERVLLEQGMLPDDVDVLVVGHHGAADATSVELVKRLEPKYAVVSINDKNLRGYPSKRVLTKLEEFGAEVHVTYKQSDFVFGLCGSED